MQISRIAIAASTFTAAFCLTHFWPKPAVSAPVTTPVPKQPATPALPAPGKAIPVSEIVTNNGLLDAAGDAIEITDHERAELRFGDWAKRDPRGAIAPALEWKPKNPLEGTRQSLLASVFISITEEDPDLALDLAAEIEGHYFYEEIFSSWPLDRCVEAGTILSAFVADPDFHDFPQEKRSSIYAAARETAIRWPEDDALSLIRWLSNDARWLMGSVAARNIVAGREIAGIDFIGELSSPEAKGFAATAITKVVPHAIALQAIELVPKGHQSEPVFSLAEVMAEKDPAAALRFLSERAQDLVSPTYPTGFEPTNTRVRSVIDEAIEDKFIDLTEFPDLPVPLRKWLELEVAKADEATLLAQLPPNDPKSIETAFDFAERWAHTDIIAASEWLATLDSGPIRDQAIMGFVKSANEDPKAASAWADTISDPGLRERYLRVALRRWKASDLPAATAAIEEYELSEMAKTSLLRE